MGDEERVLPLVAFPKIDSTRDLDVAGLDLRLQAGNRFAKLESSKIPLLKQAEAEATTPVATTSSIYVHFVLVLAL